jgi:hypothetical protein
MTTDPLASMSRSAYGYAGDDPTNATDPTGKMHVPGTNWCVGKCHKDTPAEAAQKEVKKEQDLLLKTFDEYAKSQRPGLEKELGHETVARVDSNVSTALGYFNTANKCLADDSDPRECSQALVNSLQTISKVGDFDPFAGVLFEVINHLLNFVKDVFKTANDALSGTPAGYTGPSGCLGNTVGT